MASLFALFLGAYIGYKMGQQVVYDQIEGLLPEDAPTFAEIQAEVAREGLQ